MFQKPEKDFLRWLISALLSCFLQNLSPETSAAIATADLILLQALVSSQPLSIWRQARLACRLVLGEMPTEWCDSANLFCFLAPKLNNTFSCGRQQRESHSYWFALHMTKRAFSCEMFKSVWAQNKACFKVVLQQWKEQILRLIHF